MLKKLALTACCALLTATVTADADFEPSSPPAIAAVDTSGDALPARPWAPAPFQAHYRARYDGVPFSAKGRRILVRDDDGDLRFFSDLRMLLLQVEEEAIMRLGDDGSLTPHSYAYRQRGLGGGRNRELDFDWEAGEVRRSGDKVRTHRLDPGYLDPVSWQLALRRDVSRGGLAVGDVVEYAVTDGGEPKTYTIELRGAESVELPCGTFETVMLERVFEDGDTRETRIWLAPEFDYMLVRLEAVDDSGKALRLELLERPGAA